VEAIVPAFQITWIDHKSEVVFGCDPEDLPLMIDKYVKDIETQETDDLCLCLWRIHPDDVDKPSDKQRKRRMDEHPVCPLHTKAGFLLYFFVWLKEK
jgi:hypothetical protein